MDVDLQLALKEKQKQEQILEKKRKKRRSQVGSPSSTPRKSPTRGSVGSTGRLSQDGSPSPVPKKKDKGKQKIFTEDFFRSSAETERLRAARAESPKTPISPERTERVSLSGKKGKSKNQVVPLLTEDEYFKYELSKQFISQKQETAYKLGMTRTLLKCPFPVRFGVMRSMFIPQVYYKRNFERHIKHRDYWNYVDKYIILGAAPFKADVKVLYDEGVRGIVNMCEEWRGHRKLYKKLGIVQKHLPMMDFTQPTLSMIEDALEFMAECVLRKEKVYVHCKAGKGRSATVVICWLLETRPTWDHHHAQAYLEHLRPHVSKKVRRKLVVQEYLESRQKPVPLISQARTSRFSSSFCGSIPGTPNRQASSLSVLSGQGSPPSMRAEVSIAPPTSPSVPRPVPQSILEHPDEQLDNGANVKDHAYDAQVPSQSNADVAPPESGDFHRVQPENQTTENKDVRTAGSEETQAPLNGSDGTESGADASNGIDQTETPEPTPEGDSADGREPTPMVRAPSPVITLPKLDPMVVPPM